jgi:hypothetical protein
MFCCIFSYTNHRKQKGEGGPRALELLREKNYWMLDIWSYILTLLVYLVIMVHLRIRFALSFSYYVNAWNMQTTGVQPSRTLSLLESTLACQDHASYVQWGFSEQHTRRWCKRYLSCCCLLPHFVPLLLTSFPSYTATLLSSFGTVLAQSV